MMVQGVRREHTVWLGPYCEGHGVCAQVPWGHILENNNSDGNGEDGRKGTGESVCMCWAGIMVPFLKSCWGNFTN